MLCEGNWYVLTIVDSHSRYCLAIPLKLKIDVSEQLSDVINIKAKRFGYYPLVLHSNRGSDFINSSLKDLCRAHLICSRAYNPYTPQQNSIAERGNQTTSKKARALLKQARLPSTLGRGGHHGSIL